MTDYDPWAHLRSLGDRFAFGTMRLPVGRGWWCADVPGIVLDDRLSRVERRCVLAHELVHVEQRDRNCAQLGPDGSRLARRQERLADAVAAERLVTVDDLVKGLLWAGWNDHDLAEALDVDLPTLVTRRATLTPAERAYIDRKLWRAEGEIGEWSA